MKYVPSSTLQETGDRFFILRTKFLEMRVKYGYPDNDARSDVLNTCSHLISSVLMRMALLISLDKGIITQDKVKEIFRIYQDDLHNPLQTDMEFLRRSFVVLFQFQIENLLKIILYNLEKKDPPKSYFKIVERLLTLLKISPTREKIHAMNTLAYMRNCMHSNGMHTQKSITVIINEHKFEFVKDQSYLGADWSELHLGASIITSILEEILDTVEVQSITPPLHNQYIPVLDDNDLQIIDTKEST